MLLMTSSRTSSIMAEKKKKWPIYCDFSHFTSIIWPCGRDKLKSFSHILFKLVMHVTNKWFLDKFNNGRKKKKRPIYCDFSHFTSIIWPCGAISWKVSYISSSNWLCMLLISSSWTSSIMAEKKKWPIYCDFSHFTSIIWSCGRENLKSFSHILFKLVMHITNK